MGSLKPGALSSNKKRFNKRQCHVIVTQQCCRSESFGMLDFKVTGAAQCVKDEFIPSEL